MKMYALKSCDTCRKAIRELREAGFDPVITDVRQDGLTDQEITGFLSEFGDALINRKSTTWRQLSDQERNNDPHALLRANPTLMKRPVIVDDGTHYLGWGPDVRGKLLG